MEVVKSPSQLILRSIEIYQIFILLIVKNNDIKNCKRIKELIIEKRLTEKKAIVYKIISSFVVKTNSSKEMT